MMMRNYIGLKTLASEEIRRFVRIWPQTILAAAINMMLYFLIFQSFAGEKVIHNTPYMQFITPGLILMAIIINSYSNVAFSLWSQRSQGSIDELTISPMPHSLIILGYCIGGMLRGLFVGLLVAIVSLIFTHWALHNLFVVLTMAIVTAALFSLAGFCNALLADKFDDVLFVPTFILTPLTLLGGIFYSLSQLPVFWQRVSLANPLYYLIDVFRYGMLGLSNTSVLYAMIMITGIAVGLFYLNLHLLNRGVGFCK